jgi:hypothetical protein
MGSLSYKVRDFINCPHLLPRGGITTQFESTATHLLCCLTTNSRTVRSAYEGTYDKVKIARFACFIRCRNGK